MANIDRERKKYLRSSGNTSGRAGWNGWARLLRCGRDRPGGGFPNARYEPHASCGDCPLTARSRAKKSGRCIPKNRCRTTVAERLVKTRAELPLMGDQIICLSHEHAGPSCEPEGRPTAMSECPPSGQPVRQAGRRRRSSRVLTFSSRLARSLRRGAESCGAVAPRFVTRGGLTRVKVRAQPCCPLEIRTHC